MPRSLPLPYAESFAGNERVREDSWRANPTEAIFAIVTVARDCGKHLREKLDPPTAELQDAEWRGRHSCLRAYDGAMQESPKKTRWYHYQPPLPAWFPGWLVACLVVGTTTFLAFWFGLNELSWKLFVLSFGLGFGMTLCILVLAFLKAKPE